MSNDVDTNPDDIWEARRRAALRTFQVFLSTHDGSLVETVFAHYWDNSAHGGHLNFYTIEPSGRRTIRDAFSQLIWLRVKEIHDHETDRASAALIEDTVNPADVEQPKRRQVH